MIRKVGPAVTIMEKPIPPRQRRRIRHFISLAIACAITYYLLLAPSTHSSKNGGSTSSSITRPVGLSHSKSVPHPPELLNNLSLTTSECEAAFPGLTWSIQDVIAQGPFILHPKNSPVLGRISSSPTSSSSSSPKIYPKYTLSILQAQRKKDLSQEMLNSRSASLHQIHRALLTAPPSDPILVNNKQEDIIFSLNFQDQPYGTSWAYSRQADPNSRPGHSDGNPDARTFLMPHFSFWAWKLPFIGSMWRAADAITSIEEGSAKGFASKIPKAVWRGTTWFNSVHNPRLRANLLAATKGKPWADVEALHWDTTTASTGKTGSSPNGGGGGGGRTASNSLPIEDFCRYKYVLHTEGVTYSGRFQFLQMCESVVLTPPIGWMQHTTHLVKPLFSSSLTTSTTTKGWTPSEEGTKRAWPTNYGPESEEANIVFVAPDWSDLEETIAWLETHPDVAAGIARRQREMFVGGGYFSPAAETCYWRALVRGWGEVVKVDEAELAEIGEGQTFEAFVLNNGD